MGNNPVSDLIIGIDPGKTTGLAVLDGGTREMLSVHSLDFWGAIDYCLGSPAKLIVVELPDTKAVWSGKGVANAAAAAKVAVNVGGVLREAELMVDGLLHAGKTVITHHPLGKIDHKTFVRNTGWTGASNEHTRDAGMLCYLGIRHLKTLIASES